MALFDHAIATRYLLQLQRSVRDAVVAARDAEDLHAVEAETAADTIYAIDAAVEPGILAVCEQWAAEQPMVLLAEGVAEEPLKLGRGEPVIRVILDPIDGTRGLMYDKRAAWSLGGVAPDRGDATRLRDIEVAAMTELPTSKMSQGDVLWASTRDGYHAERHDLLRGTATTPRLRPSTADGLRHGFASAVSFFPGTKVLTAELIEHVYEALLGPADVTRAAVFDDQYIATGGQWYELIAGHDRFTADLRPTLYELLGRPDGLCCHPYDAAAWLVAEMAGVILTDVQGEPLDAPMDLTTSVSWLGYANATLRAQIEPVVLAWLRARQ